MDHFLLVSVRDAKAREFESLVQTFSMSMFEYDIRFTQLSRYVLNFVLTEEMKVKRFVNGLVEPLFIVVEPQKFASYSLVVDCARMIEIRSAKSCTAQEKIKKAKIEGHQGRRDFNVGRDSSFSNRQGQQWETLGFHQGNGSGSTIVVRHDQKTFIPSR
ncbi:hypothetical protein CRYUN_Cryun12cG0129400 [Craigia yunnanensis]